MPLVSLNPATGRIIRRFDESSPASIEDALNLATHAFLQWRRQPVADRALRLRGVSKTLLAEKESLAVLMTSEMGKPLQEARAEIEKCAAACDYYAEHVVDHLAAEKPAGAPPSGSVHYSPLGTILGIMPWNFPFWQVFRASIPAIAAGNVFLLKHASNVCGCALACQEVFNKAGLPSGIFQTLLVESDKITALIQDPRIHAVTLTGSTHAGRKVAQLAGESLKPCVLELGGSDPYLVLADADLDHAAKVCAQARLVNGGQSCVAAKRFIIVESVLEEFLPRFVREMTQYKLGDPMDETVKIGPLAREDLRDEVHRIVRTSLDAGAYLHCGGACAEGPGFFYPPTVLSQVTPNHAIFSEEVFGPVAAVVSAPDESTAVDLANRTHFGLGAAIFTRDIGRGEALARDEIHAGMVFVNAAVRSDPSLPFGGVKSSGFGRELGTWGSRSFVNVKTLWLQR